MSKRPRSRRHARACKVINRLALPHGVAAVVALPRGLPSLPSPELKRLHPQERAYASELKGHRQVQWVGGRLALRAALGHLGQEPIPCLSQADGGIELPQELVASVSHKRDLAVGMVGFRSAGTLGVDLETLEPARSHLAPRIPTAEELQAVDGLEPDRRWLAILLRFTIKEAIYKALYPRVQRYIGFDEAQIVIHPNGLADVRLQLEQAEGPYLADARYHWLHEHVLASVRIRRQPAERGAQEPSKAGDQASSSSEKSGCDPAPSSESDSQ